MSEKTLQSQGIDIHDNMKDWAKEQVDNVYKTTRTDLTNLKDLIKDNSLEQKLTLADVKSVLTKAKDLGYTESYKQLGAGLVMSLQIALKQLSKIDWNENLDPGIIDGVYMNKPDLDAKDKSKYANSKTRKAVKAFQAKNGLEQDGWAGPLTIAKLLENLWAIPVVTDQGKKEEEHQISENTAETNINKTYNLDDLKNDENLKKRLADYWIDLDFSPIEWNNDYISWKIEHPFFWNTTKFLFVKPDSITLTLNNNEVILNLQASSHDFDWETPLWTLKNKKITITKNKYFVEDENRTIGFDNIDIDQKTKDFFRNHDNLKTLDNWDSYLKFCWTDSNFVYKKSDISNITGKENWGEITLTINKKDQTTDVIKITSDGKFTKEIIPIITPDNSLEQSQETSLDQLKKQYVITGLDGDLVQSGDIMNNKINFIGKTTSGENVMIEFIVANDGKKFISPRLVDDWDLYYNLKFDWSTNPKTLAILPDNSDVVEKIRKSREIRNRLNGLELPNNEWSKSEKPVDFSMVEPFDIHLKLKHNNQEHQINFDKDWILKSPQELTLSEKNYLVSIDNNKIVFTEKQISSNETTVWNITYSLLPEDKKLDFGNNFTEQKIQALNSTHKNDIIHYNELISNYKNFSAKYLSRKDKNSPNFKRFNEIINKEITSLIKKIKETENIAKNNWDNYSVSNVSSQSPEEIHYSYKTLSKGFIEMTASSQNLLTSDEEKQILLDKMLE